MVKRALSQRHRLRARIAEGDVVEADLALQHGAQAVGAGAAFPGARFITSPSMRTDSAVSWYSLTRPTMEIKGCVTRPDSIWKAISAPTDSVLSNTSAAPTTISVTAAACRGSR